MLLLVLGLALGTWALPGAPSDQLGCWFVEEAGGNRGVMPSALSQRRALILLPAPGSRTGTTETKLPFDVEPGLAFEILDPSGTLLGEGDAGAPLWSSDDPDSAPACELNAFTPQAGHVPWAEGLVGAQQGPRADSSGGAWFIISIQSPQADYGVSSILHGEGLSPRKQEEVTSITTATVVLSVFSRAPHLRSRLGQDVLLDCGFSAPPGPFSVEWRYQHRGSGRVVLAYDGATGQVSMAEEGVELYLEPGSSGGNASLLLRGIGVRHEGTYICTIYLPQMHAQQALELLLIEPPVVALRPSPLSVPPGAPVELACEISGYYPLDVTVSWQRHSTSDVPDAVLEAWESGHRRAPDGTFSITSFARLAPARSSDHGVSYSCHVSHVGLAARGLRRVVRMHVAGVSGPSVEDGIGLFLVAFLLYGALKLISERISMSGAKEKRQKSE